MYTYQPCALFSSCCDESYGKQLLKWITENHNFEWINSIHATISLELSTKHSLRPDSMLLMFLRRMTHCLWPHLVLRLITITWFPTDRQPYPPQLLLQHLNADLTLKSQRCNYCKAFCMLRIYFYEYIFWIAVRFIGDKAEIKDLLQPLIKTLKTHFIQYKNQNLIFFYSAKKQKMVGCNSLLFLL